MSRPESLLFPGRMRFPQGGSGPEIDDTTLYRIWQKVQQRLPFAQKEILSLHALRNTFAVRSLREAFAVGDGPDEVVARMGFVDRDSIEVFVKLARES